MPDITFRLYEELNDYLPLERRKGEFVISYAQPVSIRDAIRSLAVPCEEVDLILVNGVPVDFSYLLKANDRVSLYPVFETFDISGVTKVRATPLRDARRR